MANNFANDPNCAAVWRFEPGALFVDSKGNNTLASPSEVLSPSSDTINFKEGSGSAAFEEEDEGNNNDRTFITDDDLDLGFPFKSGDTIRKISAVAWVRLASNTNEINYFFRKGNFAINITETDGVTFRIFKVDSWTDYSYGSALSVNTWYHIAVIYNGITGDYRISIWDDTAQALLADDVTGTAIALGAVTSTTPFHLGNGFAPVGDASFRGNMDEVVIFNDILSTFVGGVSISGGGEIEAIREGTYRKNVLDGLDHLEGETVSVLVDGAIQSDEVVSDGEITPDIGTLGVDYSCAVVGIPFTYQVSPMRLDITTPVGTTHGSIKKISELVVSFFETLNAQYGDGIDTYSIDWRTEEEYGSQPDLFTGDKIVAFDGGFSTEDNIVISGSDPFPCTVRAIIPRIEKVGR
jgi:hypothetical protein